MTTVLDLIKEEGIQEGIQKGIQEGIQKGIQEGIQKGIQEGIQEGIQKGIQKGRDEDITRLLRHSSLSPQEIASILEVDLSRVLSLANSNDSVRDGKTPEP